MSTQPTLAASALVLASEYRKALDRSYEREKALAETLKTAMTVISKYERLIAALRTLSAGSPAPNN